MESEHWKAFRAYILSTRPLCQICKSPYCLQVHHRNYRHLWHETPKDVAVLCERCHKMISSGPPWLWRMLSRIFKWFLFRKWGKKGEKCAPPLSWKDYA